ncbi:hypothetical protein ACOME3_005659 [Neoechinorhynchus agilis]
MEMYTQNSYLPDYCYYYDNDQQHRDYYSLSGNREHKGLYNKDQVYPYGTMNQGVSSQDDIMASSSRLPSMSSWYFDTEDPSDRHCDLWSNKSVKREHELSWIDKKPSIDGRRKADDPSDHHCDLWSSKSVKRGHELSWIDKKPSIDGRRKAKVSAVDLDLRTFSRLSYWCLICVLYI